MINTNQQPSKGKWTRPIDKDGKKGLKGAIIKGKNYVYICTI